MIHLPVDTPSAVIVGGPNLDLLFVSSSTQVIDYSSDTSSSGEYPLSSSPMRGQSFIISGLGIKAPGPGIN